MNFLEPVGEPSGVPLHVLIRSALEQENFQDALEVFRKFGATVSGNVCLADRSGNYVDFELDGQNVFEISQEEMGQKKYYCHTNHYFKKKDVNNVDTVEASKTSTSARFAQVKNKMSILEKRGGHVDEDFMQDILLDDSNKQFPLLRPYVPHPLLAEVGTNTFIQLFLKANMVKLAYAFENFENLHIYKL
jgi:hypothetical protein